ncbi:uncharacterized protein Bfra_005155 [Botrytis fragariae]|uniref:Uncharacterized protein n=1 Tax=Botrytis fragariae TaxID=1964551 RepID=A0A8H6EIQ5_9HELO|nr:uncharacterized protein Bfra_005155 [Botrytis fragariae]KAF5873691.1 hypothetical protein Bfra_005155 [Botrytis fragariae]
MVNIPLESGYELPATYAAGLRASPDFVPQRYAHFVPSPTSPDHMSLMGTVLPGYGQGVSAVSGHIAVHQDLNHRMGL